MNPVFTLVLAGGSGTRLWPLSREEFPKQFLRIEEEGSLYQCTLRRAFAIGDPSRTKVLSSVRFGAMALLQARELLDVPQNFVVEEPCPKNTAPAVALGLLALMEECGATRESVVFVCPSDHIIREPGVFEEAVRTASAAARNGNVCVFGIPPTRPDTGFGYVRAGGPCGEWRKVERFVEKPSLEKAEEYLEAGDYFWNGGMFIFTVGTMLDALAEHLPETAPLIEKG
ncbi:MAG TPA: sugar phosphate nucleotidyltransferase, partial [Aminobacteriaceae bacterium]|nr:sugar phosphate nucleotidyltransferase [Aminobacteriaceae bacterium]